MSCQEKNYPKLLFKEKKALDDRVPLLKKCQKRLKNPQKSKKTIKKSAVE